MGGKIEDNGYTPSREFPVRSWKGHLLFAAFIVITLVGAALTWSRIGQWEWNRCAKIITGVTGGCVMIEMLFYGIWLYKTRSKLAVDTQSRTAAVPSPLRAQAESHPKLLPTPPPSPIMAPPLNTTQQEPLPEPTPAPQPSPDIAPSLCRARTESCPKLPPAPPASPIIVPTPNTAQQETLPEPTPAPQPSPDIAPSLCRARTESCPKLPPAPPSSPIIVPTPNTAQQEPLPEPTPAPQPSPVVTPSPRRAQPGPLVTPRPALFISSSAAQQEKLDTLLQAGFECQHSWQGYRPLTEENISLVMEVLQDCVLVANRNGEVSEIIQENTSSAVLEENGRALSQFGFRLCFKGKKRFQTVQEVEEAKTWLQGKGMPFVQGKNSLTLEVPRF